MTQIGQHCTFCENLKQICLNLMVPTSYEPYLAKNTPFPKTAKDGLGFTEALQTSFKLNISNQKNACPSKRLHAHNYLYKLATAIQPQCPHPVSADHIIALLLLSTAWQGRNRHVCSPQLVFSICSCPISLARHGTEVESDIVILDTAS